MKQRRKNGQLDQPFFVLVIIVTALMALFNKAVMWPTTFVLILALLSYIDLKERRLPNLLTALLGVLGILFALDQGGAYLQLLMSPLFSLVILGGAAAYFYRRRGMMGLGMGDIKMMLAGAFWISPMMVPICLLIAAVVALLVALVQKAGRHPIGMRHKLPFGPYLALGLIITWVWEPQILKWLT